MQVATRLHACSAPIIRTKRATRPRDPGLTMRRVVTAQADIFSIPFYSRHRHGEIWTGVLAMCATIVGGGTLSIPWAVERSGLVLGGSLLLTASIFSAAAVKFLLAAARRHGGLCTYDQVLEAAFGAWARHLTVWSVVATCFLTLSANQILLRQLVVPLAAGYVLHRELSAREGVLLGICLVLVIVPLTFLPTLHGASHRYN